MSLKANFRKCPVLGAVFILMLMLLGACQQMKPEKPEMAIVTRVLENEVSVLHLPIVLETAELEDLLNKKFKKEIYQDLSFSDKGGDNLKMTISRAGKIRMDIEKDKLLTAFPLEIWIQKRLLGLGKGKQGKDEDKGVTFQIELQFESLYHLDEQWRLITRTAMQGWRWIEKPMLQVGFVNVDISGMVEKALRQEEGRITGLIDKSAREQVNLRKAMGKVWADIQKPILVNRKMKKVWLKAEPFEVKTAAIKAVEVEGWDALLAQVELSAFLTTLLGDGPTITGQKSLPNLKFSQTTGEEAFNIHLLATVPHYQLNEAINQHFKNHEIAMEGHKVKVRRVEVSGSEETLVVKVGVRGDVNGEVYFRGKPYYDSLQMAVGITDFDFDMHTQEMLLKTADWMMHDTFREEISRSLFFPLEEAIGKLPELISQGIEKGKAGKKIRVEIEGLEISMKEVLINQDQVQLLLNARGRVQLNLRNL